MHGMRDKAIITVGISQMEMPIKLHHGHINQV